MMDNDLYNLGGYSEQSSMAPPHGMVSPVADDYNLLNSTNTTTTGFDDQDRVHHAFGSDSIFPAPQSADSDAASMAPTSDDFSSEIRAKIASHPLYPKLLEAYIDCRKVGAPPELASSLDEIRRESEVVTTVSTFVVSDPELDEFMESYCDILVKYKSDLSRPFDEATSFLNEMQAQLNSLSCSTSTTTTSTSYVSDAEGGGGSSEEEEEHEVSGGGGGGGEMEGLRMITQEDRELKEKLLRKYSGYISTLKLEFSKKKKKGKLPKQARQTLLDWWTLHYRWPYPTETDKIQLAELTGLDQKQINNWFINQRKRHWKPPENMQVAMMEAHSIYASSICHNQ
ncbi:hypothetical protein F8388_008787 [Cannabis sativa]|uniref:Uncharacterized protein n=1 Tax=Cannabis sativa TaxID=3483 RepID=A0A7J6DR57_CANSA|nr:hypothetical protein F8388_008787 [Cannabis sativa]KAF4369837.1 hypothetical protein G4B88_026887 [Cannabis sativa]